MNNAVFVATEQEPVDKTPWIRERISELETLVSALDAVDASSAWQVLRDRIFNGVVETLEKKLSSEAKKDTVNNPEIYRLQGQLVWAKKYADLRSLGEAFRQELKALKERLQE